MGTHAEIPPMGRLTVIASHNQHQPLPRWPCISAPSPHNCACGQLPCPAPILVSELSPHHRPERQPGWSASPSARGSLCSREQQQVLRGFSQIKKPFPRLLAAFNTASKSLRGSVTLATFITVRACLSILGPATTARQSWWVYVPELVGLFYCGAGLPRSTRQLVWCGLDRVPQCPQVTW